MKNHYALGIALVAAAACANEVYRDPGSAGAELEGGEANGQGGAGGGNGVCGAPLPSLPYMVAAAVTSTGTGAPEQCSHALQDASEHMYWADCTVEGCSCRYDDVEVCSCEYDVPLAACDAGNHCCPEGWPEHDWM